METVNFIKHIIRKAVFCAREFSFLFFFLLVINRYCNIIYNVRIRREKNKIIFFRALSRDSKRYRRVMTNNNVIRLLRKISSRRDARISSLEITNLYYIIVFEINLIAFAALSCLPPLPPVFLPLLPPPPPLIPLIHTFY